MRPYSSLSFVRRRPLLSWLGIGLLALPPAAAADDWLTFNEVTDSRVVADASVSTADFEEKDVTSGDVDQDGDTDIVVVRKVPFTNAGPRRNVLFMNEDGVLVDRSATLAPDFLTPTDDREVELADVDGDGWLDIITAGTFDEQPRILMNLGEDGGVWQGFEYDASRLPFLESGTGNGPKFCGLGVGDVTGDHRPELYFTDYDNDLEDKFLLNDGTGFFTDETVSRITAHGVPVQSTFGVDADIVDVNGDGWNDIIKNNSSGNIGGSPEVWVLYNDGTGNFTFRDVVYDDNPYMVAPADFTQDGRLDLVIVDDGQDSYLINTGNDAQNHAQFTTHFVGGPATQFFGGNVKFADLDANGVLDVLVADVDTDIPGYDRRLVVLEGQGVPPNISYADPLNGATRPWTPLCTFDIEPFDLDGDAFLDLWVGTCTGVKVFLGVHNFLFRDGFETGDTSRWVEE